jgi:hypothetical protein
MTTFTIPGANNRYGFGAPGVWIHISHVEDYFFSLQASGMAHKSRIRLKNHSLATSAL